jgi:branched-chain amino acid transport system permease protein
VLQAGLSGYTSAWLLYVGLFFIVMVVYAPGGLASLIEMHARIPRTKAWRRVMRAYGIALVPALALAAGGILLIEMSYRVSTQPELGTVIELFRVHVDAANAWSWIVAALAIGGGASGLRRAWRGVVAAWNAVDDALPRAAS